MDESRTFVCLPVERWLPVAGFPAYEVSDQGRARSLDRTITVISKVHGLYTKHLRGRMLRLTVAPNGPGYPVVTLSDDAKQVKRFVHQLVADAFLDPRPEGQIVRHGPNGKLDNRAVHLEWGTYAENSGPDRERDGTLPHGSDRPFAKLTEIHVAQARSLYASGEFTFATLAGKFGVNPETVRSAIIGDAWKHVTGTPKIVRPDPRERKQFATLTVAVVTQIRERYAAGERKRVLAAEFGVTSRTITRVVERLTWKHVA